MSGSELPRFARPPGCLRQAISTALRFSPLSMTPSFSWTSTSCRFPDRASSEVSRVRGAQVSPMETQRSFSPLLCNRATILLAPDETRPRSPIRGTGCCLLRNVSGSTLMAYSYEAVSILGTLRGSLQPGCFPVYASQMLFRHPSTTGVSGCALVTRWLPRISMT